LPDCAGICIGRRRNIIMRIKGGMEDVGMVGDVGGIGTVGGIMTGSFTVSSVFVED